MQLWFSTFIIQIPIVADSEMMLQLPSFTGAARKNTRYWHDTGTVLSTSYYLRLEALAPHDASGESIVILMVKHHTNLYCLHRKKKKDCTKHLLDGCCPILVD